MAAILRSGKFLRMVTGLTRSGGQNQQGSQQASKDGSLVTPINTVQYHALPFQQLQNALPILSTDNERKEQVVLERRASDPLLDFYVDKQKIEEATKSFKVLDNSHHIASGHHVGLNLVKEIKEETEIEAKQKELEVIEEKIEKIEIAEKPVETATATNNESPLPSEREELVEEVDNEIPVDNIEIPEEAMQLVPLCEDPASHQWYPLPVVCQMFRAQGRIYDLEGLLWGSQGIRPEDRKCIYYWTLQAYADCGMFPQAVDLTRRLETEGLATEFPEYHTLMNNFAMSMYQSQQLPGKLKFILYETFNDMVFSKKFSVAWSGSEVSSINEALTTSVSSVVTEVEEQSALQSYYYRKLKKAIGNKEIDDCIANYRGLEKFGGKDLNVTESSTLIELFVKGDFVEEAIVVTERMLAREAYPLPRIFRFLLNRLAAKGQVDAMNRIGFYLTPKIKKEVSFDNRLCNGYLAAGRAEDYLNKLILELEEAEKETMDEEKLQVLKDKFPRGGAMGLLESNPDLVKPFTQLALKFVDLGYVAPVNVLWTYHFISGRYDLAMPLWNKYVRTCPQIMFQKVCQTARATANTDLAERLVGLLENAAVTNGARGIAYSCLLDVLTQNQEYEKGIYALKEGLESGIRLDDVNRTALRRLKEGLEIQGHDFPYDIPHKSNASIINEDEQSIRSVTPSLN